MRSVAARSCEILGAVALLLIAADSVRAQNPIQVENSNPGTSGWQLSNPATGREIEGFASLTSVNVGGSIDFLVSTSDSTFKIEIFRTGWYGGVGARLLMTVNSAPGGLQATPTPDPVTGLIECKWTKSYTLSVPTSWVSGIFLARLTGNQSGKQSYSIFVVRDDARSSAIVFESAATTFQAYNFWPNGANGKSLYDWAPGGRAWKVSFNRPYVLGNSYSSSTPGASSGVGAGDFLTNLYPGPAQGYPIPPAGWEYNMVRWLEKNGYDVTYLTGIDLHENASLLTNHSAYLSIGHNEYWSANMRQNVQNALNGGLNLGFFSSNSVYWQVRLEPGFNGAADRTMVCYKYDAATNDPLFNSNPSLATVEWRQSPVNQPEAALQGNEYIGDPVESDIVISNASHWLMNGTGLQNGSHLTGILGYEVDAMVPGTSPANTTVLASSPVGPFSSDFDNPPGFSCNTQQCNSNVTWYSTGHAFVFATGSLQWSWGLDDYNAPSLRNAYSSAGAQTLTANVLSAFITPVTVTTTSLPAGTAGVAYSAFQVTASGGGPPYTWTASGLPSGMNLSSSGVLSGTPAAAGAFPVTFTATDSAAHTGSKPLNLVVNPSYAISGQITLSGSGLAGVTVTLSTGPTTTTNSSGNYSFSNLPTGTYTVTPSLSGYTFTPSSQTFTNITSNQTANFTATRMLYTISGQITLSGSGLAGVTVALSTGPTTTTNSSGNYSFSNLPTGTYTVTPSLGGYTFTPSSQTFTNITSNQTANFTAALAISYTISGQITLSGSGLAGVTVALSTGPTTTTNSSGNYSFSNLPTGTYTVTPSLGGYTFTPPSQTFTNITSNQTANFTAALAISYTISGQITLSGSGLAGVTVALSTGPTTTTNSSGNYSFSNLPTGTYTVTPSLGGYTFTPSSQTFTNITSNQTANFTAALATRAVSIKFVGTGTSMGASESAGVVAKTNWNNATGNTSSSALNLVDETGVANGASVTWDSDVSWNLPITDSPGNFRMIRGYIDSLNASDSSTVAVTGLPASPNGYDIYVYSDGDNQTGTETGTFRLSGAGITTTNFTATDLPNTNFSGTFIQAINSAGNYVKFTAVHATAFTITATPAISSDGVFRAPINGIQIIPSAAPGTARTVGIKLVGTGTAMGATESAGVIAKANWNNATGNNSSSPLNLVDETGAANGAIATWASDVSWNLPVTDSAGNVRMMRGYIDSLSASDSSTVNVTGLPPSSTGYDIYVYTDGDNQTGTEKGNYQLTGPGITTVNFTATDLPNTNFSGTFTRAINSAGNYVKFTAVQATTFTITATPAASSDGVFRAPINSIQIVPSAAPGVARAVGIKLVGAGTAMGASESAGVVAKTNWNNATGTTSGSPLSLVDETGAANGASATWASDVSWNLPIADSAGNVRMMRGYIDSLNGSDSNTVTVADLPPSPTGYDIYVYTDGDNATAAKTATYQLSGAGIITASNTATDSANTNFSGTFTQANNSAGNYVKFTAIQATSFTITATPKTAANGVLRAPVNGIQVVPH